MKFKSYAKINLSLDVLRKREDGYHDLCMVMHSVNLYDDIDINFSDDGKISLSTNLSFLPCNNKNHAYMAADLFFKETGIENPGIKINIFKRIPVSAGLAGGSSNAAAVLRGLNEIFDTKLSKEQLAVIGKKIGADVPYCIYGGTMLAEGIGEILTPLPDLPECPVVLVKPDINISTPSVFKRIDVKSIKLHPDTKGIISSLKNNDLNGVCKRLYNVLEAPAEEVLAESGMSGVTGHIKSIMLDCGAIGTLMSGSGPTVYGIFSDENNAKCASEKLKKTYPSTLAIYQ